MGKLTNKVALITGGTSGIGYESARLFRDEGATVIVTGSRQASVDRATAELGIDGFFSDITKVADIEALMTDIRARYARIDVLFSNAGLPGLHRPIDQVDERSFDSDLAVNFRGHFFTVQKALPLMPDGSTIILTASVAAHFGFAQGLVYAASKAAIRSLGRGLAAELLPRGIRVNTLTPGLVATPLFDKLEIPAADIIGKLKQQVPMARAAHPREMAHAALFLAASDSSFMTGAEIKAAGGQTDL